MQQGKGQGLALAGLLLLMIVAGAPASAWGLETAAVTSSQGADLASFDGVVEATRQTVVAAQVAGAIVALPVKAGDSVKAGQVLARIDARSSAQNGAASEAQVRAARAAYDVAAADYQRQQQLFKQSYISRAALERAESQFNASSAQLTAQIAQASAAQIETGYFVVRAPYAGVIAEVPVELGDMAAPGKPLMTIYDPAALRVTASVPQSALPDAAGIQARIEIPDLPAAARWQAAGKVQVLPAIDAATHAAQVRAELPAGHARLLPGTFARLWLPGAPQAGARLYVPATAIVRRAELTGIYVLDRDGRALLRQVRLGASAGNKHEVLAGVSAGEQVVLDPQAAAQAR